MIAVVIRSAILYHIYSGHLFFTAIVLFVIGIAGGRRLRVLPLLAIPLAALSGTPMPLWAAAPLLVITSAAALTNDDRRRRGLPAVLKGIALAASIIAAAWELQYHPTKATLRNPSRLIVIGDSLSSGGFSESRLWPQYLGVPVENLAQASDTAATALSGQLPLLPPPRPGDMVIVELGGNDMIERKSPREFEQALDQILSASAPRKVVMLELPVIPGGWSYGAAQRRLAAKHRVTLVPKRVLAGVLADPRNSDDGLHLTERGHEQLARGLAGYVGWDQ